MFMHVPVLVGPTIHYGKGYENTRTTVYLCKDNHDYFSGLVGPEQFLVDPSYLCAMPEVGTRLDGGHATIDLQRLPHRLYEKGDPVLFFGVPATVTTVAVEGSREMEVSVQNCGKFDFPGVALGDVCIFQTDIRFINYVPGTLDLLQVNM